MDLKLFGAVDEYITGLFEQEDSSLTAVEQSIKESNIPPISVSPNQGKFLQMLATGSAMQKILDIGNLAGYSTIWLARHCQKTESLSHLNMNLCMQGYLKRILIVQV